MSAVPVIEEISLTPVMVVSLTSVMPSIPVPVMIRISHKTSAKRYQHCHQYHSQHDDFLHFILLCFNLPSKLESGETANNHLKIPHSPPSQKYE